MKLEAEGLVSVLVVFVAGSPSDFSTSPSLLKNF